MEDNNIKTTTGQVTSPIDIKYNTPSNNKFNFNYKLIFATFIFLIFAFILAYFLFFKKSAPVIIPVDNNTGFPIINPESNNGDEYYEEGSNGEEEFAESEYGELVHIWPLAVSGYSILKSQPSTSSPLLTRAIFMDQASGNIHESEEPLFEARLISSEIIENVLRSAFSYNHSHGVYLDNKFSLYLIDIPGSTVSFLEKTLLGESVLDFTFSKNANKLAFLKKSASGSSLSVYDIDNKEYKEIYSTPLSDLTIEWLNADNIIVKSKPSNLTTQTIIQINIKTKKVEILTSNNIIDKIVPDYKSISFDGTSLYYTESIRSLNKNKINIQSIPDKCIHVSVTIICGESLTTNIYSLPDEWYKGNTSFIDYLTLYNTENKKYFRYELSLIAGQSIDFYKPVRYLDALTFLNKRDLSLWLLDTSKIITE